MANHRSPWQHHVNHIFCSVSCSYIILIPNASMATKIDDDGIDYKSRPSGFEGFLEQRYFLWDNFIIISNAKGKAKVWKFCGSNLENRAKSAKTSHIKFNSPYIIMVLHMYTGSGSSRLEGCSDLQPWRCLLRGTISYHMSCDKHKVSCALIEIQLCFIVCVCISAHVPWSSVPCWYVTLVLVYCGVEWLDR